MTGTPQDASDGLVRTLRKAALPEVADAAARLLQSRDDQISDIKGEVHALRETIGDYLEKENEMLNKLTDAFPEGDTRAHREAHEAWMKREANRDKLRQAVIEKSLISFFLFCAFMVGKSLWQFVQNGLKLPN